MFLGKCIKEISIFVTLLVLSVAIFGVSNTFAQSNFNKEINYQGKLTDSTGATVADGLYDMEFKLYDAPTGGSTLWTETLTGANQVQVTSGLFSVMLGSTTALTGVDFNQTLYLGVNIESDGEMTPRKILGAVPAAFEANNAETFAGIATTSFLRSDIPNSASALLTFTGGLISSASSTITELTTATTTVTTLIIDGEEYTTLSGGSSGLTNNGGTLTANISESNLNIATGPTNGYVLQASSTSAGGFVWQATSSLGITDTTLTVGSDNQIPFSNGGGTDLEYSSTFVFDSTSLGIGTTTLPRLLSVAGASNPGARFTDSTNDVAVDIRAEDFQGFVGTFSNNDLRLVTNNVSRMTIDTAGDVGIGTTSPASTLDVWGDFRVGTSSTPTLFTDVSTGFVGIGTDAPLMTLSVAGDIDVDSNSIWNVNDINFDGGSNPRSALVLPSKGSSDTIEIMDNDGTGNIAIFQDDGNTSFESNSVINVDDIDFNGGGNDLSYLTIPNKGATDRLDIFDDDGTGAIISFADSGNVGIGTTNPGGKLEIEYAGTTGLLVDSSNTANNVSAIRFNRTGTNVENGLSLDTAGARKWFFGQDNDSTEDLLLYGQTNTRWIMNVYDGSGDVAFGSVDTASPSLYIEYDGNVGIGTTSPVSVLDLWSNTSSDIISVGDFDNDAVVSAFVVHDENDGEVLFDIYGDGTGGSSLVNMYVSGNLGIGTTSPYAKLSISQTGGGTDPLFVIASSTNGAGTSTALFVNENGQVIVGDNQTSSEAALVVYKDSPSADQTIFQVDTSDISSVFSVDEDGDVDMRGTELRFTNNDRVRINALRGGSVQSDYMQFYSGDVLGMHIQYGKVGIGTTSPDTRLHIGSSTPNAITAGEQYNSAFIAGSLEIDGTLYDNANSAGTNGMVLQTTGSGFAWVATSSLGLGGGSSLTVGSDNQIPFSNAGGTDLEYSSNFTFDGTLLTVAGTVDAETFNATTDTVLTYNGAVFALASSTLESVTLGDGAGGSAAALETRMTAIGDLAGGSSSGANFTGVGYRAGNFNTDNYFTGVGTFAGQNNTGDSFAGVGGLVGTDNTGNNFSGLGRQTGRYNTGNDFTGIGYGAGVNNTGDYFTGLGSATGGKNTGDNNTFVGYAAGFDATYYLSGSSNTFLGANSTYDTSGLATSTITNATAVGANVTLTDSNSLILGNGANVGIGTTSPASKLDVWGDFRVGTSSTPSLFVNAAANQVAIGTTTTGADDATLAIAQSGDNKGIRIYGYDDEASTYSDYYVSSAGVVNLVGSSVLQLGRFDDNQLIRISNGGVTINNNQTSSRDFTVQGGVDTSLIKADSGLDMVGIGTSTPASKLDVWGDFRVGTSSTPTLFVDTSADQVMLGTTTAYGSYPLYIEDGAIAFRNTGNLTRNGTIQASGSGYLQVDSTIATQLMAGGDNILQLQTDSGAVFNVDGDSNLNFIMEGDTNGNLFYLNAANDTIGISTSTATQTFTVDGSTYLTGALYDNANSAGTNGMVLQTTGSGFAWVATSSLGLGGGGSGTVTSVDMSVPTGLAISGNPITDSGTLALTYDTGYTGVLTASTTEWDTAYGWGDHSVAGYQSNALTNGYVFRGGSGNTAEATSTLFINDSGNVGVGTITPRSLFTISGNTTDRGTLGIENDDTDIQAGETIGSILFRSNEGSASSPPTDDIVASISTIASKQHTGGDWGSELAFSNVNSSNVLTERMRIDANGYVGIGTSTDLSARLTIQTTGTDDILNLLEAGGTEVLTVLESGNVGIGTTTPDMKLTVAGSGINVNRPSNPTITGGVNTDGESYAVAVVDRYAYVADGPNGLEIIDVSDPASPAIVGGVDTDGTAFGVALYGRYAYIADGTNGLEIIDVSDPTNPTIVGGVDTDDDAYYITLAGPYAYVSDNTNGLEIIDVSDPTNPTIVGGIDTDGSAYGATVVGRYAYLADGNSGLKIIDVSDPTNPTIVGEVNTTNSSRDVTVSGRYAYVAHYSNGVEIFDVSDPTNPTSVGTVDTDAQVRSVALAGRYLYAADGSNGLEIIDVFDPTNPVIVGGVDTANLRSLTVSGRYVYAADHTSGLQIIDINGSEFSSLFAGTLGATQASFDQDLIVGQNALVNSNLSVGSDARIGGNLAIQGYASSTDTVNQALLTLGGDTVRNSYMSFTGQTSTTTANIWSMGLNQADNSFRIASSSGLLTNNYFTIGAGGNVGIGTTSPTRQLSVVSTGTSWPDAAIQVSNTVANRYAQIEYAGTGRTWTAGVGNASETLYGLADKFYVYDQTGNAARMAIDTSGYIGIGTSSPQSRLHLNGGVGSLATGLSFGDGDSGFYESSDDSLRVSLGGTPIWRFSTTVFGNQDNGKASINTNTPSATTPTFLPGGTNDTDTGIGWASADILSLVAGGVNGLNVNAGDVGVGTTSPFAKFTVTGDVMATGALYDNSYSAGTNGMVLQTTGSGFAWVATSTLGLGGGGSSLTVGSDNEIPFSNAGGTDFDYSSLFTFDGTTFLANATTSIGTTTATNARLSVQSEGTADILNLFETGGTEVFTVLESGNVGIETDSPGTDLGGTTLDLSGSLLEVENTSGLARLVLDGNFPMLNMADRGGAVDDKFLGFIVDGGIGRWLSSTDSGGTRVDNILVMDMGTGRVGIGLNNPSEIFHVSKSGGNVNLATFENSTTSTNGSADIEIIASSTSGTLRVYNEAFAGGGGVLADTVYFGQSAGTGGVLLSTETTAPIRFATDGYANERMIIGSDGNIGIGTTSPSSKLDVWGDFRVGTSGTPTLLVNTASDLVTINNSFILTGITSGILAVDGSGNVSASTSIAASGIEDAYVLNTGDTMTGALTMSGANIILNGEWLSGDGGDEGIFIDSSGNVGIGTTTPGALLTLDNNNLLTGNVTAGIEQYITLENATLNAVQYGDRAYIKATSTATSTIVGGIIRIEDATTLGNTVRGFEVQANKGANTQGENTALSGFARTFGVRGYSSGDAGGSFEPAGGFFETGGSTQGNAIRGYSASITTAELLSLFQEDSVFTGTGLLMNFGNDTGSFASTSSKFVDFQNAGTSKFTVTAHGTTTIGDGTTSNQAGLQIGFGGLCVDNDGSCVASTTGRISSVSSYTGNSDLAEMYFSSENLTPGEIVVTDGFISIERATGDNGQVLGVVSTKPGLVLGSDDTSLVANQRSYPLALSGRVPVRLSNENGNIAVGDPLTLSSLPGIAMKATEADTIVGYALEAFDGTYAYTDGFVNQFGDDIAEPNYEAINVNPDTTEKESCYFGGGLATGEEGEECDPEAVMEELAEPGPTAEEIAQARYEAEQAALNALRNQAAETYQVDDAAVKVGTVTMFVDRGYHFAAEQMDIFNELTSTSTDLVLGALPDSGETLWSRLKELAQGFVDGVLSIAGLKADKVETSELCIDDVCVTADDLRALLEAANTNSTAQPPAEEEETEEEGTENTEDNTDSEGDNGNGEETAASTDSTASSTEEVVEETASTTDPVTEEEDPAPVSEEETPETEGSEGSEEEEIVEEPIEEETTQEPAPEPEPEVVEDSEATDVASENEPEPVTEENTN